MFRDGYQAVANAIWSLVAVAARTVSIYKTVQRGTITFAAGATSATATLAQAVDTTKAVEHMNGWNADAGSGNNRLENTPKITLTNSTTVTATRAAGTDSTSVNVAGTVNFVVKESY